MLENVQRGIQFYQQADGRGVVIVCVRICEGGGEVQLCQRADGIQQASECAVTVLLLHNRVVLVTSEELNFVRLMLCLRSCFQFFSPSGCASRVDFVKRWVRELARGWFVFLFFFVSRGRNL